MEENEEALVTARLHEEEAKMFVWNYNRSSPRGPTQWGKFNAACARGVQQSPIDLSTKHMRADGSATPLMFNYAPAKVQMKNDGKVIRGIVFAGGSMTVDDGG